MRKWRRENKMNQKFMRENAQTLITWNVYHIFASSAYYKWWYKQYWHEETCLKVGFRNISNNPQFDP